MLIKTLCLASRVGADAPAALGAAAQAALRSLPGLRQVQVNRVVRQIPTDYIDNDRPYSGVVAQADSIDVALDLWFADAATAAQAAAAPAWAALMQGVQAAADMLFALDSEPHIPVPLKNSSEDGGFRRWLLLTRKPATREAFREAWFIRHANFVKELPLLDGYVQNLVSARYDAAGKPVPYEALPIDGIAEVCYADEAAMNTSYASPEREPLKGDGAALNARVSTLLVQGRVYRRGRDMGTAS